MTQREAGDVREYYRLITEVDIGDVAQELLAEISACDTCKSKAQTNS